MHNKLLIVCDKYTSLSTYLDGISGHADLRWPFPISMVIILLVIFHFIQVLGAEADNLTVYQDNQESLIILLVLAQDFRRLAVQVGSRLEIVDAHLKNEILTLKD